MADAGERLVGAGRRRTGSMRREFFKRGEAKPIRLAGIARRKQVLPNGRRGG